MNDRRRQARPDDDRSAFTDAVLFIYIVLLIFAAAAITDPAFGMAR